MQKVVCQAEAMMGALVGASNCVARGLRVFEPVPNAAELVSNAVVLSLLL